MSRKPSKPSPAHSQSVDEFYSNEFSQPPKADTRPQSTNALKIKLDHLKKVEPLTENQQKFWDAYDIGTYAMMLYGSAGTGKTWIALYKALTEVLSKETPFERVIIVRSAVTGRDQGFLPGSLDEKMSQYAEPYKAICQELFGRKDAYDRLSEQGMVTLLSTSYLRGSTFNDAIIIFDEFQNSSWQETKTVISRLGNRSKIILCGDYGQNDLNKTKNDVSGFPEVFRIAEQMKEFVNVRFTTADIVRSSFSKSFLIACEKLGI